MASLTDRQIAERGKAPRPQTLIARLATQRAAAVICVAALLGLLLGAAGLGSVWPDAPQILDELVGRMQTAHAVSSLGILLGLISLGLLALGPAIEFVLSIEVLHKTALAVAVMGPLSMAETGEAPTSPQAPTQGGQVAAGPTGIQIGLYGGGNSTPMADVFLKQPNGTDMVLKDVPWTGEPFDDPPFYGVRGIYWLPAMPAFGAMIDFTHAKSISLRKREVDQTGTRDGEPVPARQAIAATFTKLEYSHGLNFLTLNAVYRFRGWYRRFLPYIGAGAGLVIPHTEIARKGVARQDWTYRYEVTGPGFQGLAGLEMRLFPLRRYAVFAEYKAGYAINSTELLEGGTVKTNLWAHQAILGVYGNLRGPLPVGAR